MSFHPYTNGKNLAASSSFDDYDSIGGEYSIQMNQYTDDESMVMSELGSVLGGASMIGRTNNTATGYGAPYNNNDEIYEDDDDTPQDCASFINSEMGIPAGDVSAILFGGRSAAYQPTGAASNYVNGMYASSEYDSHMNTSVEEDTVADLFVKDIDDDHTEVDSIINPSLDVLQMLPGATMRLGPLGDELSYAQDESTANPPPLPVTKPDLHLDMHTIMIDHEQSNGEEEEEDIQKGILPLWISTSNSRTKSLLVVSAALIVGSLVMAVVAFGANSQWWMVDDSTGSGPASLSSEVNGEAGEVSMFDELTVVPTLVKPSNKPSVITMTPVSDVTGENFVEPVTDSPTDSPTKKPSTDSPTASPSEAPVTNPPTLAPTTNPTKKPTMHPTISPSTKPTNEPSASATTKSPTVSPTLSQSTVLTTEPSDTLTSKPSAKPTVSMSPSLSVGTEGAMYGDATFYLMAEGGTNVAYWKEKLQSLDVSDNNAKFLVHLGSAARKVDNCTESAYLKTEKTLKYTAVPVYAVPGNYDWPLCTNRTRSFNLWKKHFASIDSNWTEPVEYSVRRQVQSRPENFAFLWKRTMFVGLHTVQSGDDDETTARIQDNLDWVNENVESHFDDIDVIFMMGHGRFTSSDNVPFYDGIVTKKKNEWKDKYVIYARRAGETSVLANMEGLSMFDELRVGAEWPILDVRVSTREGRAKLGYREVANADEESVNEAKRNTDKNQVKEPTKTNG